MLQTCNSEVPEKKKSLMKASTVFTQLYKSFDGDEKTSQITKQL